MPLDNNTAYNMGLLAADTRKSSSMLLYAFVSALKDNDDVFASSALLIILMFPTTRTVPVKVLVYVGADF